MNKLKILANIRSHLIRINQIRHKSVSSHVKQYFLGAEQIKPPEQPQLLNTDNKEPPKKKTNLLIVKSYADIIFFGLFWFSVYKFYQHYKKEKEHKETYQIEYVPINEFKHKCFRTGDSSYLLPDYIAKNLGNLKNFDIRKDDVFIISFPKSGTTWLQEMIFLILNNCDYKKAQMETIEQRAPFFEYPTPGLKFISSLQSPRILKTHLPKAYLPDDFENKCKAVYIARNPKDVAISYFNFVKMSTQAGYSGEHKEFIELFMNGNVPYGPWWKHVDDYLSTKNIHVLYYEDLQTNPKETIKQLCTYLGKELNDSQIDELIKWCSYESMKSNSKVNYDWYKEYGLFKKDGNFFRKGIVGDWLNIFDVELSSKFDKCIEENLKSEINFNYGIPIEDIKKLYEIKAKKSIVSNKP